MLFLILIFLLIFFSYFLLRPYDFVHSLCFLDDSSAHYIQTHLKLLAVRLVLCLKSWGLLSEDHRQDWCRFENNNNQAVSVWIVLTVPDIRLNFNTPFPSVNSMESNIWTQAN